MEHKLADEVRRVASPIIEEHHPHLNGVRIECVFVDKAPKSAGKDVWARAKKISGLNAFLASSEAMQEEYGDSEDFFVIEVFEGIWQELDSRRKRALVDHELSHMEIEHDDSDNVKLAIVGHDVTEFAEVLRRHGLWNDSLEEFSEQLSLLDDQGGPARSMDAVSEVVERLRPDPGDGIESVTISSGDRSVTLSSANGEGE